MLRRILTLVGFVAIGASGCAHQHLRWNTVEQSRTLTQIYEQQVLDNLAMFVHDPDSLPFFSFPTGAASDVNEEGSIGTDMRWNTTRFVEAILRLNGKRGAKQAWTLSPVSDPRRLELMRCAYQQVVSGAGIGYGSTFHCPDCERLRQRFYLGTTGGRSVEEFTFDSGRVTTSCLSVEQWFGWGCSKCAPKHDHCSKYGHYCGTCVWLLPGGQNELSKLTLIILDYAINQPPPPPVKATKEVTWYLDEGGLPTTSKNARQVIKAVVPFGEDVRLGSTSTGADSPADAARARLDEIFNKDKVPSFEAPAVPFAPPNNPSWLQFNQDLRFLTPQAP